MDLVILESPFAGDVKKNQEYARACMRDCLLKGESPYASHLLFTQEGVLDDLIPNERQLGIDAGLAWGRLATKTVVYGDLGVSRGMEYGITAAIKVNREIEYRNLLDFTLWLEEYNKRNNQINNKGKSSIL